MADNNSKHQNQQQHQQKPKTAQFYFPDKSFIRPGTSDDIPLDPTAKARQESVIQDTYFANLFREWMNQGRIGYDITVHAAFQEMMVEFIERSASVQMVLKDITSSAKTTGAHVSVNAKALQKQAMDMLELWLFKSLTTTLGLDEYVDDMVSIKMQNMFGQTDTHSKRREQKKQEREDVMMKTAAGIHNMVRDIASSLKHSKFTPSPIDPNHRSRAAQEIVRQITRHTDEDTGSASEAGTTQYTETQTLPGPS